MMQEAKSPQAMADGASSGAWAGGLAQAPKLVATNARASKTIDVVLFAVVFFHM
jgi:hypothetical protein